MIKFVHAADLHLDAPFGGLSPEQAVLMRQEQRMLPERLAELCRTEQADLLLLPGDVFDSNHVYRQTLDALHRAFAQCGAQVFIAPGNHDPMTDTSVWNTEIWEPNIHIFTEQVIRSVRLEELNCTVFGAAFTGMDCPALLEGFRADGPGLRLMTVHGDAEKPASSYNPMGREQIARSGLHYLALGHVHSFGGARRAGMTTYAWPGCPQGRGFDETGEKGVLVGELDESGCKLRFVPLCTRRYEIVEVYLQNDPISDILREIPDDTGNDCYRILLKGEAEPDLGRLCEQLKGRFFGLQLRDETTPPMPLWESCGEDSLRGLFLRGIREALERTDDPAEAAALQRAAKLGVDLMDGREVTV